MITDPVRIHSHWNKLSVKGRWDMELSPQQTNVESPNKEPKERIPKQVKLAAWLAVFTALVIGGVAAATPWNTTGPCIGIAVMMAVVCFAIIKYR